MKGYFNAKMYKNIVNGCLKNLNKNKNVILLLH